MCGLLKVFTSYYKSRVTNRTSDKGDNNSSDDISESDQLDKILGGNFVTYGEVPWQANILLDNRPKCSGAIISEYWVITAASCVS